MPEKKRIIKQIVPEKGREMGICALAYNLLINSFNYWLIIKVAVKLKYEFVRMGELLCLDH